MTRKTVSLIVVLLLVNCGAGAGGDAGLRLHLPRTVRVRGRSLRLEDLGVIRGSDAALVRKASGVAMGRAPWSAERIVIDRRTILSRLATAGLAAETVRITGAEKVVVVRDETAIKADRLVASAKSFLEKTRPGPAGCGWRLVRRPKDLAVPAEKDIRLRPSLSKDSPTGHVRVQVAAVGGGRELGRVRILFKLVYPKRQVVAIRDIAAGEILTPQNVAIRAVNVEHKPPDDWTSPYGMIAVRTVPAGKVIRRNLMKARAGKPAVVVRRNQAVRMKIVGLGFTITALGTALQDGRAGELIKVRNIDSKRIVTARVAFDGTVTPVYEKR